MAQENKAPTTGEGGGEITQEEKQHDLIGDKEKKEERKRFSPKKKKKKKSSQSDDTILEEEGKEAGDERATETSNNADSNNNTPTSSTHTNILRRTMSFLASLPRKLIGYVRDVFYAHQDHSWSHVGHDDSEESDWSCGDDVPDGGSPKKQSAIKPTDRQRRKPKKAPPPIAPKPKKKDINGHMTARLLGSGSSNPPSSPDTTTPDSIPDISFDDITHESPQLKIYKRIHGPQGRRKPQRFSNQSDIRQSEIQPDIDPAR